MARRAALVLSVAFAWVQPALAEPARARLVFAAPDGASCLDERALRDGVVARLGRDPFADDAALTLRCTVLGSVAMIELGDGKAPGRVRTLRFPEGECAKLAAAVVLTIRLAPDHDDPGAGPPPPPPAPPPP